MALEGYRVGVVDTDIASPGMHALFGMEKERMKRALNNYLGGRCPTEECAYDAAKELGQSEADAENRIPSETTCLRS
jgi:MinD-like ATPase involved in chromosome partitioning or flagellar assembly